MNVLGFEGIEQITLKQPDREWDPRRIHRELVEQTKEKYLEMDKAQQKSIEDSFKTFIGI